MNVFCYCRDSGGPGQDRSIGDQRKALELWAEQNGHTITRWFVDEAQSGTKENREHFQEMIAVALKELPYAVVVWNSARFARDMDTAQYYKAMLRRAGVQVVSINDTIPDGPIGRIAEVAIDYGYELQVATLRYEVKRGQRALLKQGFVCGGRPPSGYRGIKVLIGVNKRTGENRFGTRWEIDEDVAPLIRQAFAAKAAGETIKQILRDTHLCANRQGMSALLRNPVYKGVYRYGAEEWAGIVPALVDEATWRAAQDTLNLSPKALGANYLLSGLLRCGYCGYAMTGFKSSRKRGETLWERRYYICGGRNNYIDRCAAPLVRADDLELDVAHYVFDSLLAPAAFTAFVASVRAAEQTDTTVAHARLLDQKIAQTEQKQLDLIALVGHGIAVDEIARRLKDSEAELRELRQQRASLITPPKLLSASEEELRAVAVTLRDRLDSGSFAIKRTVLHQVVERIEFGPDLTIRFKLPHTS